ncbi:L,D-transpeptidase family protein [Dyella sp.]|uniref:L,D-transpeptidase family protein n=1 Tax=Dyella sp. TaxID=1869338 RepID=UPI002ED1862E
MRLRGVIRVGLANAVLAAGLWVSGARAQATEPVGEAIHDTILQVSHAHVGTYGLGRAVIVFYGLRMDRPVWTRRESVDQLFGALQALREDGLDPNDYGLDQLQWQRMRIDSGDVTPQELALFDLRATDAYLTALTHLYLGKIDPNTLDEHWNYDTRPVDLMDGLKEAGQAIDRNDIAGLFDRARPQHPVYNQLRHALATMRDMADRGGWPEIPEGPTLKPGMKDERLPVLRQRLVVGGYLSEDHTEGDRYDDALRDAVKRFQQEQYLEDDGNLGASTRAALNVTAEARVEQIRVNLERARWLLHAVQGDFVLVDIAGYKIAYFRDGQAIWTARVQVGKPYRSTPVFKSRITYITLNPTWTVPPTILKQDILPKVRANSNYLAANRIRVLNSKGEPVEGVDWNNPRGIVLRQDPGPGNSLGRVVIRFPNPYAIYLHDTPHQNLFQRGQRAASSGCIRVENPRELAELLLDDKQKWSREAIDKVIDSEKTQSVILKHPVPVLLAYWTVELHENDRPSFRQDIYDRDDVTQVALQQRRWSVLSPWMMKRTL